MRNYITRELLLGLQRMFCFASVTMSTLVTFIVLLCRFDSKYNMYNESYLNYLANEALIGSGYWFSFTSCFIVLIFINNIQSLAKQVFRRK